MRLDMQPLHIDVQVNDDEGGTPFSSVLVEIVGEFGAVVARSKPLGWRRLATRCCDQVQPALSTRLFTAKGAVHGGQR